MKHVAFFVAGLILVAPAGRAQQNPSVTREHGSISKPDSQKEAANPQGQPAPFCDGCFDSVTIEQPHRADKRVHRESRFDKAIYRIYLIATIVGVIGALVGLYFVWRQGNAIDGQLQEMKNASGQTRQLISHAEASADAAKAAAKAASLNADALMNAERAWLMIEVKAARGWPQGYMTGENSITSLLEIHCRNDGKSPAWITETLVRMMTMENFSIPSKPDFDIPVTVGVDYIGNFTEPISPGSDHIFEDVRLQCGGIIKGDRNCALIYGVVKYLDIFRQERYTRFAYFLSEVGIVRRPTSIKDEYNKYT